MKILTLKSILFFACCTIILTLSLQTYLIFSFYQAEEKKFSHLLKKSVQTLFDRGLIKPHQHQTERFIIQPDSETYLISFNSITDIDSTFNILVEELSSVGLSTSFNLACSYDGNETVSPYYEVKFVNDVAVKNRTPKNINKTSTQEGQNLRIHFPEKNWYLLRSIKPWIISCLLMIFGLAAVGILLYHYYKHRFWNGVQKQFINNFIHEFRTPVSVISIAGKVLQGEGIEEDSERLKKYARLIKEQTDQLQQKISQILELALSGRKDTVLDKQFVDVNTLVATAVNLLEPLIQEKKARVELITTGTPGRQLFADPGYLTQAIVNVLDNSLKYANLPEIRLETAMSDKSCAISIRDNGIGMEEKYFKHIFRKYYRIPTGNVHNVKGFGIGLNFVKNVIDAHNGRIEVSSVTGKGTEFRIKLPLT